MKQLPAPALPPAVEARRLAVLHSYEILDTPRESAFDDITRIASMITGTPIALVTLVDSGRQWFKSEIGMGVSETPIEASICAHVVAENDVVIVSDISSDPRFGGNAGYTGNPSFKFYAGAPITTADGVPLGAVCVLDTVPRSLTKDQIDGLSALARQVMMQIELRKMLKDSERTSDYRARMLASAAHDLRQPLFIASLSVQSLFSDAAAGQSKRLKMADQAMETLKKGFNRMLVAANGSAAFSTTQLAYTDLGHVLEYIQANFAPEAEDRQIRFRVVGTRLRVFSDADQLITMLGNLVSNAVKYTPPGGRIVVGCRRHKTHVSIQIIDTGIGMATGEIDALFDAFRQGDVRSKGLGLGLWIVRRAAQALDVTLAVHSVQHEGTRFTLAVPTSPPP